MERNSTQFFQNMSRPSGVLTAPGQIGEETAARLKRDWEENFAGGKIGRVAVLGDALKYEAMAMSPKDAVIVEQARLSAEKVCSAFGVPRFMIEVGDIPSNQNTEALWQLYFSKTLQKLVEAFENLQDDGLGLDPAKYRTEFDLDDLLRMDSKTLAEVEGVKVKNGIAAPDESRRKFNLPPVPGGGTPYLQQQNYSLGALAKRDAQADPFATAPAPSPAPPQDPPQPADDTSKALARLYMKAPEELTHV